MFTKMNIHEIKNHKSHVEKIDDEDLFSSNCAQKVNQ